MVLVFKEAFWTEKRLVATRRVSTYKFDWVVVNFAEGKTFKIVSRWFRFAKTDKH